MVVDLAVENHGHRLVLVEEGLMAGGAEIDDREAPHSDSKAVLDQ
jgi:hypothetical protein